MHIAEGVLSLPVLASCAALSAPSFSSSPTIGGWLVVATSRWATRR